MENQVGKAGKSTREMANNRRKITLWIGIGGLLLILLVGVIVEFSSSWGFGGIGLLVLLFGFPLLQSIIKVVLNRKIRETKRAVRGAKAEEKIGELLAGLSSDFYVLNDIESPLGNIDHIVISKNGGVFLLETKAHGGRAETVGETLLINGKNPEKDFLSQTLNNTYWLRDKIGEITHSKPWIHPIIVFTNAFVSPSQPIKGVHIINKKFLMGLLHQTNQTNSTNTLVWEQKENIKTVLVTHS